MTNSFRPAPDFASVLSQSFQGLNESLSRQEAMERENDRRRLQNASMPLKMFEALADFSATAAKAVKAQRDATIAKVDSGVNSVEENAELEERIKLLNKDASIRQKIKGKAKLANDLDVVDHVNESISLNFKQQAETLNNTLTLKRNTRSINDSSR